MLGDWEQQNQELSRRESEWSLQEENKYWTTMVHDDQKKLSRSKQTLFNYIYVSQSHTFFSKTTALRQISIS